MSANSKCATKSNDKNKTAIARRITDEELPESGRVDKVKWNFIYEGDHGLAMKLQEEEFTNHFSKNKEERWVMRENLKEAKVIQSEEEERLQIERMRQIEEMQELARRDEEIARKIQEQEETTGTNHNEEEEKQLRVDESLALRLEDYEKERMKKYREYRRIQMEHEDLSRAMATVDLNGANSGPKESLPVEEDNFDTDFTDFLSQLPEGLSQDEVKVIQELEDGELAKLLQEAESKRSGARTAAERMQFIRRRAVELRDEQLARAVQQREISRYNNRRSRMVTCDANDDVAPPPTSADSNSSNYTASPVRKSGSASAAASSSRRDSREENMLNNEAYVRMTRQPKNFATETYLNVSVDNQQPHPPSRPRPLSTVALPQRTDSYSGAVAKGTTQAPPPPPPPPIIAPSSSAMACTSKNGTRTSTDNDDYLTPNSLLDGSGLNGSSSHISPRKNNPSMQDAVVGNEGNDYELPPEIVEIDHAAIAASRNRRNQTKQQRVSAPTGFKPLPVITPGAKPTVTAPMLTRPSRPQSELSSSNSQRHSSTVPQPMSATDGLHSPPSNPIVTNPMYIIERPSKSKPKNSECRPQ